MKASKFNCSLKVNDGEYLIFNTLSGCIAIVPKKIEDFLSDADIAEKLLQKGFLVDDKTDEDLVQSYWLHRRQFDCTELKLEILTTFQCNLNCEYCAAKNRISDKFMNNVVAEQVISWIIQRLRKVKSRRLHLTFSGGEPFMNLDEIFRICRQLHDFCNRTHIEFSFNVITNGTLLKRESIIELRLIGLRGIQVTLDGPQEIHDKRRQKINGKGSFCEILDNLRKVVNLVKSVDIRINLDFQNHRYIPELLQILVGQSMCRPNVQIQIARTYSIDLTTNISQRRQKEYNNETVNQMTKLYSFAERLGFRTAIDKDNAFMPYEMCMFISPNSFVVDAEGWIYKCIGFVPDSEFRIGHVKKESFNDTLVKHTILGTKITQESFCNKCAFKPLCSGGCRYLTYVQTGNPWKKLCPKQYFQKASLELLRIKYLKNKEVKNESQ